MRVENLTPDDASRLIVLWDARCDLSMGLHVWSSQMPNYFGDPQLVPDSMELHSDRSLCDMDPLRLGVVLHYAVPVAAAGINAIRSYQPVETSPSASPADDTTIVTFQGGVVPGRAPFQAAVVDRASHLVEAQEATPDRIPPDVIPGEPSQFWIRPDPSSPTRTFVGWTGSVCDGQATVTIDADLKTVTVDPGRHTPCDAMAVDRALVLTFDTPVAGLELLASVTSDGTPESPG